MSGPQDASDGATATQHRLRARVSSVNESGIGHKCTQVYQEKVGEVLDPPSFFRTPCLRAPAAKQEEVGSAHHERG